jgi:hypothetical protein
MKTVKMPTTVIPATRRTFNEVSTDTGNGVSGKNRPKDDCVTCAISRPSTMPPMASSRLSVIN